MLKLHPHTHKFDVTEARVAALASKAGELGVIVLTDNANIMPGDSMVRLPRCSLLAMTDTWLS